MQMSIVDARPFATRDGTNVNILVPTTAITPPPVARHRGTDVVLNQNVRPAR